MRPRKVEERADELLEAKKDVFKLLAELRRWDNAVAESFFSSLEKERVRKKVYRIRDLAKADIFEYIQMFYNRTRRHSHLGGVSPETFEAASNRSP